MFYNVGIYVRLSKESDSDGESGSISNQIKILSSFIDMMPNWIKEKTYVDDGFTGGNFDRPAFQEMVSDAKAGIINLLLVKDLSRFGRNYLEAGHYLREVLPKAGCRFVSISENIDTAEGETDIMDFMNFLNDLHLKNLSKNIKAVLTGKAKKGQYLMGSVPYGYKRSGEDKHKILIDEYAADIVKTIFEMRLQKIGFAKIAAALNKENIIPPRVYYCEMNGSELPEGIRKIWRDATIKSILRNEIYIGNTVQHKTGTLSHRSKKLIKKDESQWIRVENTHTPIISREMWGKVQALDLQVCKQKPVQEQKPSLFGGLLYCADCKSPLIVQVQKDIRKNGDIKFYYSYVCTVNRTTGGSVCSRHVIYEKSLVKLISDEIKQYEEQLSENEESIIDKLKYRMAIIHKDRLKEIKSEHKRLERSIHSLNQQISNLYEDKLCGIISSDTLTKRLSEIEKQKADAEVQIKELRHSIDESECKMNDIRKWMLLIRKHAKSDTVDRTFLNDIIDRIEIGERAIKNGSVHRDIRIIYKYVGSF